MSNTCLNQLSVTGSAHALAHFMELFAYDPMEKFRTLRSREPADQNDWLKAWESPDPLSDAELCDWGRSGTNLGGEQWPCVYELDITCSPAGETALVSFVTDWDAPVEWLGCVSSYYKSLRLDLVWVDVEAGRCGQEIWAGASQPEVDDQLSWRGTDVLRTLSRDREAGMALIREDRERRLSYLRARGFRLDHSDWGARLGEQPRSRRIARRVRSRVTWGHPRSQDRKIR